MRNFRLLMLVLSVSVAVAFTAGTRVGEVFFAGEPASGISCEVFGGVAVPPLVEIFWGPLPPKFWIVGFTVLRDGEPIASLGADALGYSEEPLHGEHLYTVIAVANDVEDFVVGDCLVDYDPPVIGGFVRGDVTTEGSLDITDAVVILIALFRGGDLDCHESADVDDSGAVELSDPVHLLQFLFRQGSAPPAPFPDCGHDLTQDQLTCDFFPRCFTPPPP